MVLARLVAEEIGLGGVAAESFGDENRRQPTGAIGDLVPGQPTVAPHDALTIAGHRRGGFVHCCDVQLHRFSVLVLAPDFG